MDSPSSTYSPCCEDWNAAAVPPNAELMVGERTCLASFCTSATAWLSATFGATLKEMVTEGSCPEWLMLSGPTVRCEASNRRQRHNLARSPARECRAARVECSSRSNWGIDSMTTQYSLVGV